MLLIIAVLVVAATMLYGYFDSKRTLRVGGRGSKPPGASTGPAPVSDSDMGGETSELGTHDANVDTRSRFLGLLVGSVLGVLFIRIWTMQVIGRNSYTEAAESNYTSTFTTRASRGRVLDRNGVELIGNRPTLAVIAASDVASDRNVVHRLSNVLGIPVNAIRQRIADTTQGAQADRVVMSDAPIRSVAFIREHPQIFPGITIDERTVRTYPYGTLAAHVLGYTGTVSEDDLKNSTTPDGLPYESGDIVGKSGVEQEFESILQGVRGEKTVQIDAAGNVISLLDEVEPQKGNDIRLTIDVRIQQIIESQFDFAFTVAAQNGFPNANAGCIIVLDPHDNAVLGMASYPTFDPSEFIGGISNELWESLNSSESGYPLTNRAVAGLYPAASTMKPYSALTALKKEYVGWDTLWTCTGVWTALGAQWAKKCWLETGHGTVNLVEGLAVSCDIVFYDTSLIFYNHRDEDPNGLQDGFKEWGLGQKTGIDLPDEAEGRIPTAEWKAEYFSDTPEEAQWNPGDMANIIIGQGDVLITPIQNACGYAGISTGVVHKPHVLKDVLDEEGNPIITIEPTVSHTPDTNQDHLDLVRQGLQKQAADNGYYWTFPLSTGGKTGTGQVYGKDDLAWYIGYVPADNPDYVVAMCIEQGGAGNDTCGRTVRRIMDDIYGFEHDEGWELQSGESLHSGNE